MPEKMPGSSQRKSEEVVRENARKLSGRMPGSRQRKCQEEVRGKARKFSGKTSGKETGGMPGSCQGKRQGVVMGNIIAPFDKWKRIGRDCVTH